MYYLSFKKIPYKYKNSFYFFNYKQFNLKLNTRKTIEAVMSLFVNLVERKKNRKNKNFIYRVSVNKITACKAYL